MVFYGCSIYVLYIHTRLVSFLYESQEMLVIKKDYVMLFTYVRIKMIIIRLTMNVGLYVHVVCFVSVCLSCLCV